MDRNKRRKISEPLILSHRFVFPITSPRCPTINPVSLSCSLQISEIYVSGESGDLTAKEKLLLWSQQATEGYPGLRCVNFTSSWSDGRMFNALLHRYRYRGRATTSHHIKDSSLSGQ